jgi:hypothetical protein
MMLDQASISFCILAACSGERPSMAFLSGSTNMLGRVAASSALVYGTEKLEAATRRSATSIWRIGFIFFITPKT